MQVAAEAVKPVTVVDSEKNGVGDADNGSPAYSVTDEENDPVEVVSENTDKGAVNSAGGFQLYERVDEDAGRFSNMVTRHASRA